MSSSLAWLTVREIQEGIATGKIEPLDVAEADLARIQRLNPTLHAYIYVDELPRGSGTGPLNGVPVAVKDTQPVDGMPWTYGSRRWQDRIATEDSIPVRRLRAAGAIILGKTNTPELAAAIGTTNELLPPTENPWRQGFTPGGSSGGSGVAVAAGLASLALGDDMGGSIRIPAAANGVVGLRPTVGRVPQLEPDPTHLNSSGPLARSVDDIRHALAMLIAETPPPTQTGAHRIAVITDSPFGVHDACVAACRRAAEALAAAGHHVATLERVVPAVADEYIVIRPVTVGAVEGTPEEYGSAVRNLIQEGRKAMALDFYYALERGVAKAQALNALVEEEYDFIITPTLGSPPMPIPQVPGFLSEEWKRYTGFVLPVSFSGLPAISIPAGLMDGLPAAVQLVGRYRREWDLLDLAEQLQAMPDFGYRRPPDVD